MFFITYDKIHLYFENEIAKKKVLNTFISLFDHGGIHMCEAR